MNTPITVNGEKKLLLKCRNSRGTASRPPTANGLADIGVRRTSERPDSMVLGLTVCFYR
jgi:hypothetical protein